MRFTVYLMCAGKRSNRNIFVQGIPVIVDPLPNLEMLFINVVEPLIPRFKAFMLQCHNLLAESTPKPTLTISADTVSLTMFSDLFVVLDEVGFFQVGLKLFPAIENLGALVDLTSRIHLIASPRLDLVMPSILMPLPIVFATK